MEEKANLIYKRVNWKSCTQTLVNIFMKREIKRLFLLILGRREPT